MKSWASFRLGYFGLVETVTVVIFFTLATLLNLQLIDGSNVNTSIAAHDEYLTVRQVYSILEPATWKHGVMAIISGEKLYYGRVMFYLDAFVSWVPYQFYGLNGMIFATRMAHAACLILALIILGRCFINSSWFRAMFYFVGAIGFYSTYFIMLPKPEPYQLLFLSLFLRGMIKNDLQFGKHYIWLGIAFGVKFNLLPLIPVFIGLSIYQEAKERNRLVSVNQLLRTFLIACSFFILGFIIAIPCLLLAPIKPQFWATYVEQTVNNLVHVDDSSMVNWRIWLTDIYSYYYWAKYLLVCFLFGILALTIYGFKSLKSTGKINNLHLLLITGIGLFIPVLIFTKRLWPHYLWEGHILFVLVFFMTVEQLVKSTRIRSRKIIGGVTTCIILAPSILYATFDLGENFNLDGRFEAVKKDRDVAVTYIFGIDSKTRILQDPSIWYPFSEFVRIDRYNPFRQAIGHEEKSGQIIWDMPEDIVNLDTTIEFIILGNLRLGSYGDDDARRLNRSQVIWQSKFRRTVNKDWHLDTALHGFEIYSRTKQD